MQEILISGYYGFKNSGDDALLHAIISDLKNTAPDKKAVVLSKNPEETKTIYNVHAISRTNPFAIIYHLLKAKLLISGGGTLIQDATSTKSLIYYLSVIMLSKVFNTKVMLYANGIGPVIQDKNKLITKKILNKTDCITLRDEKSFEVLTSLGVTNPDIKITADPVFLIQPENASKGTKLLKSYGVPENVKILGISVRDWKKSDPDFEQKLAFSIDEICKTHGLFPVFLPLQPKDNQVSKKISGLLNTKSVILHEHLSIGDMLAVISNFHLAIGMRLHMLIYAAKCAVPIVGICYDPKISGFMDYAKQDRYVYAEKLDKETLVHHANEIMNNYDFIEQTLILTSKKMERLAEENSKMCKALLEEAKK